MESHHTASIFIHRFYFSLEVIIGLLSPILAPVTTTLKPDVPLGIAVSQSNSVHSITDGTTKLIKISAYCFVSCFKQKRRFFLLSPSVNSFTER